MDGMERDEGPHPPDFSVLWRSLQEADPDLLPRHSLVPDRYTAIQPSISHLFTTRSIPSTNFSIHPPTQPPSHRHPLTDLWMHTLHRLALFACLTVYPDLIPDHFQYLSELPLLSLHPTPLRIPIINSGSFMCLTNALPLHFTLQFNFVTGSCSVAQSALVCMLSASASQMLG